MKLKHWLLPALVLAFISSGAFALTSVPSHQACASEDEIASTLTQMGVREVMGGTSGPKDDNMGEVWVNPDTKFWVFVQRIPDAKMACVVLAGEQMTATGLKS